MYQCYAVTCYLPNSKVCRCENYYAHLLSFYNCIVYVYIITIDKPILLLDMLSAREVFTVILVLLPHLYANIYVVSVTASKLCWFYN